MEKFENYTTNDFEFTAAAWEDVPFDKLKNYRLIKNLLIQNLKLKEYTDLISSIFCIYQVLEPDNIYVSFKEKRVLREDTMIMEIYVNLDYHKFLKTNNEEAKYMMSELYLRGIKKYLMKRQDFKGKEFYKDVKELFEKHKFLRK